MNQPIPHGWRILTYVQGVGMKDSLKSLLNRWSIVAFDHGKLDGCGYGGGIHASYGPECGQRFIVQG